MPPHPAAHPSCLPPLGAPRPNTAGAPEADHSRHRIAGSVQCVRHALASVVRQPTERRHRPGAVWSARMLHTLHASRIAKPVTLPSPLPCMHTGEETALPAVQAIAPRAVPAFSRPGPRDAPPFSRPGPGPPPLSHGPGSVDGAFSRPGLRDAPARVPASQITQVFASLPAGYIWLRWCIALQLALHASTLHACSAQLGIAFLSLLLTALSA